MRLEVNHKGERHTQRMTQKRDRKSLGQLGQREALTSLDRCPWSSC